MDGEVNVMPTISKEQLVAIELEMNDLLEQLEEMKGLREENEALKAEVLRLRARLEVP
jgi:regulator of replication initiation timing